MFFFGYGASIKIRSSILFYIGKRDKLKVLEIMKTNLRYFLQTTFVIACCLFLLKYHIAFLFFKDPEMSSMFSKMISYYSIFLMSDSILPTLVTLLRTFDMNLHSSMIIFLAFGIPFISQNYIYVVYLKLEYLSPILSLFVCNILIVSSSVYFICKNHREKLDNRLKRLDIENQSKEELLVKDKEITSKDFLN